MEKVRPERVELGSFASPAHGALIAFLGEVSPGHDMVVIPQQSPLKSLFARIERSSCVRGPLCRGSIEASAWGFAFSLGNDLMRRRPCDIRPASEGDGLPAGVLASLARSGGVW
jgi:hypothetical protein